MQSPKILPITFLYNEAVCKLMLDVHNNSAPSNITKLFTRISNIHTYNPRSSTSQIFSVKYSWLKIQKKKAFSRVGVKVWNEMPNEYKNLAKKSFKKETKRALLNILENKDSYMEPDEIMLKVKKQQNWIKLNQFHNNFREDFSSFTMNICHFPFFLRIFLSFYVIFLHFRFISSVIKFIQ